MTAESMVVEQPTFSITPHPSGPMLAVLRDGIVVLNLRIDPATRWALARALHNASQAQSLLEQRMQRREGG
jgi:hypothetical protein